ncbi:hypothetical protein MTMN5_00047 [Marinobacter salarius]|nr:hypothetical protein MTMN5_00047 [Marinobacter salarius]
MSFVISFIIGEVIQPFIYGIGWALVWLCTLGRVRPKEGAFYKYPIVGLLGIYTACVVPPLVYLGLKWLGIFG